LSEEKNLKWILIISVIMLGVTFYSGMIISSYHYTSVGWTVLDTISYWVSRIGTLLFIATVTTAALSTAGFRKDMLYKASIYLFTASMTLVFVTVLSWLFRY
jgi:hypothetical protein